MNTAREFFEVASNESPVRGFLHSPAGSGGDGLVLTHGAGANCSSPLLVALADSFCASGLTVLRCDLPFRQLRPFGPPHRGSAERDQMGLRAAVASMRSLAAGRVFLGGHSYGGRQASVLAAVEPGLADALLLLAYPLHPPQRSPQEVLQGAPVLRTAHFPRLQTPSMFVHGTRDGFGSIDEMTAALQLIPARTELLSIAGAGHELLGKQDRDEKAKAVVDAFTSFTQTPTI